MVVAVKLVEEVMLTSKMICTSVVLDFLRSDNRRRETGTEVPQIVTQNIIKSLRARLRS